MSVNYVYDYIDEWAKSYPDRVALACGEKSLTYQELAGRVTKVARWLNSLAVGPGDVIPVCMLPTPDMIVTILGVLKSGAAYAPVDGHLPPVRKKLLLDQLKSVRFMVADDPTELEGLGSVTYLNIQDAESSDVELSQDTLHRDRIPEDLCYVVFTSGSTGIPKATAVRHRSWLSLLLWFKTHYQLTHRSHNLLVSSFGFDISQRSIMQPFITGATLCLMKTRFFDPLVAVSAISCHQVQTLHCAPSTLYALTDEDLLSDTTSLLSLDYVFIGGEALVPEKIYHWTKTKGQTCQLIHQYGVAECTDVATAYHIKDIDEFIRAGGPVGTSVAQCSIHILNDDLELVPQGEIGEICISGDSVGAGYLHNPEMTSEKFINLSDLGLIYRTGDLGRIDDSGDLLCIGRKDNQIKVRGIRIDLGDIESSLRSVSGIQDACAIVEKERDHQGSRLVAFIVCDSDRDEKQLIKSLPRLSRRIMANGMVPDLFLPVKSIPLSQNGKKDRIKLGDILKKASPSNHVVTYDHRR